VGTVCGPGGTSQPPLPLVAPLAFTTCCVRSVVGVMAVLGAVVRPGTPASRWPPRAVNAYTPQATPTTTTKAAPMKPGRAQGEDSPLWERSLRAIRYAAVVSAPMMPEAAATRIAPPST